MTDHMDKALEYLSAQPLTFEKFAALNHEQRQLLARECKWKFINHIPSGARKRFWFKLLSGEYRKDKEKQ